MGTIIWEIIGWTSTFFLFVRDLPQFIKTVRMKKVDQHSFWTQISRLGGGMLGIAFMLHLKSGVPVLFGYISTTIMPAIMLCMMFYYGKNKWMKKK